jgi:thiosulfate/3-mercaptopyruvate sulfurtransferase
MTSTATPLTTVDWLVDHLDDPDLRLLDASVVITPPASDNDNWRLVPGRDAHDAEHIPGSHYADLMTEFSGPGPYNPRPDADHLAGALARLGIERASTIVIYDRVGSMWAARLWWVLRSFGIESSVLDGGFDAWKATGHPTTGEPSVVGTTGPAPELVADPSRWADRDDVLAVVENGGACLINALDTSDFVAVEPTGYARAGRIPGSLSVPATGLVRDDGTFLPVPELRERFAPVLEEPGRKITYCGGGINACGDALALTLLGEKDIAVYDASFVEWAADPTLPVEVEAAT